LNVAEQSGLPQAISGPSGNGVSTACTLLRIEELNI
jgi:hypothetical protein